MIIYTEKGIGLHELIDQAGHWLRQRDGVWESNDDEAVQALIDGYALDDCRAEIISHIDEHAKSLRDAIVQTRSAGEMASWAIKRQEANLFTQTGKDTDAPLLSLEAAGRGVALSVIANKVRSKSAQLLAFEGTIAGVAGKHSDALATITSFDDLLSYDWSLGWPEL